MSLNHRQEILVSTQQLPPSTVTITEGQVMKVQDWTFWNGTPWATITVERTPDGSFKSNIGDPEHGGSIKVGDLPEVIGGLHCEVAGPYISAFAMDPITADEAQEFFPRHEIVMAS